jgi:ribosomal protein L14E/L6E/L27E
MKKSELQQIIKEEISMALLNRIDKNKSLKVGDITTIKQGKNKGKKVKIVKDLGSGSFELELVKEEITKTLSENKDNYMFFQNLKTIRDAVDEMLSLEPSMVDMILSDGHDWANDHIATSKDDVEEVKNFLTSKRVVAEKLKGGQKKLDVAEPKGKITAADFKALQAMKKK